jgi:tetratricopeptide (TPR) repeat protein
MSDQLEGRLDDANAKLEESAVIARRAGYGDLVNFNEVSRSLHANWQGDFPTAIAVGREVEAHARELHDGFHELFSLSNLGFAYIGAGDYREAWDVLRAGRALARERDNLFMYGRMTNTLGWLHQEYGDFERASELDRESADVGQRIKNGNVETSALINVGFDLLHQRRASEALPHFEATLVRAEKAFGAHRWRWGIHLRFGLATTLLALGRDAEALAQADEGLPHAVATNSRKYVGWFHAIRGEVALRAGDTTAAMTELQHALTEARAIGYPTLTWQAAHLLAQAERAAGQIEEAWASVCVAHQMIQQIAAASPADDLAKTLMAWPRVMAALETYRELERGK